MALPVEWDIQGIPGMKEALERAVADVKVKVGQASHATALDVQQLMRQKLTDGDLKAAITVEGRGLVWKIGIDDRVVASRGGDRIHQRPFIYGAILERGSRKQGARPFARPAADEGIRLFGVRLADTGLRV